MNERILVIEDEPALRDTLEWNLRREAYQVKTAADGISGLQAGREWKPDLLILDLMLPGMDGLEVCRQLRKETNLPILMLTARESETDRVVGLELGADDYITKPFHMRELIARVKAHLRRMQSVRAEKSPSASSENPTEGPLLFGDFNDRSRPRGGIARR